MGRAFEYRKARKMKRWGSMSRTFTRIGKEITIAVKAGGPDPEGNSRLRALIANAKAANMPKENIERAIKRASEKDAGDYKEVIYEGFGPHGIAVLVETATDNTTRTVANLRNYFNKKGGSFHVAPKADVDPDELELELIDCGAEEFAIDEEEMLVSGDFASNGDIMKYLEDNGFEIKSSEFVYEPADYKDVNDAERAEVEALIEALEEDDDVQNVFTTMAEAEGGDEEE